MEMNKMRFVIFGIGNMYQKYKSTFKKDIEITAFIDNQQEKWGKKTDGIMVYAPEELNQLNYDAVFILSVHCLEMRMQLLRIGIPKEKIYMMDNHIELLCEKEPLQYYGKPEEKLYGESCGKKILTFSPALSSTGAQNVLYYTVCTLQKNNFQMIVVSKEDGIMRERLVKQGIPVIIMRDIHSRADEVKNLVDWADFIFVNTLLLYDTVFELKNYKKEFIWWIHETGILQYIEDDFKAIEAEEKVSIYAVSPMVIRIIQRQYGGDLRIKELKYGLPQYERKKRDRTPESKVIFAVIGYIGYIKGQDVFLEAVDRLPDDVREKAEFWIVGGGILSEKYKKMTERYSCIKVLGEVENTKICEIYSEIDAVVCVSRVEAMSVAITEGCMNGKTPIVSDAAGIAEFIENRKTGFVFESEDIDGLTEIMKQVIADPEMAERIGMASKGIYNNYFSMDIFERNLLAAIKL